MANIFVRGTTGNNGNTGADWNNAKQTVAGGLAIASSGDIILVDNGESFTATAAITWTPPATCSIISVTRSGTNGFTWGAGAVESVGAATAAFNIAGTNSPSLFVYGMRLNGGTNNSTTCAIGLGSTNNTASYFFQSCTFDLKTAATASVNFGLAGATLSSNIVCRDCTFIASGSRAGNLLLVNTGNVQLINPTLSTTGGTKPAVMLTSTVNNPCSVTIQDADLTGYAVSGGAYFSLTAFNKTTILVKNCVISGTPGLTTGSWPTGIGSLTLRNVDSGDTINTFQYQNPYGTITQNTTTYLTAGLQFNAVGISWKIVTTSAATQYTPFVSPLIQIWDTSTSSQTAELEFVRDNATALTDLEIWSDMDYAASASLPNYTYATNRNANPFTGTGTNQPSSSAAWTGTGGFSNVTKQKLQIAFTAAEVGALQSRVYVAKASDTIYLNAAITNVT